MGKSIVHAQARREIDEICDWIAIDNPAAAIRMHALITSALMFLADFPGAGTRLNIANPRLENLRFWPLKKHPHYLIVYRPIADGVEVLRLIHGARDIHRVMNQE